MKKREGTAMALYPVKERLHVFAQVLINCVTIARKNAGARAHLSKYIRQVSEQAEQTLAPAAGVLQQGTARPFTRLALCFETNSVNVFCCHSSRPSC